MYLLVGYQTRMTPEKYNDFTAGANEGDRMNQEIGTMVFGEMASVGTWGMQNIVQAYQHIALFCILWLWEMLAIVT